MAAFKEENAITYRIDKMRKQWSRSVKKDTALVKWSVQEDEVRMVQAFSLLEGSEEGKLPQLFLNFQVPFSNKTNYAKDLLEFWLELWNSPEARREVKEQGVLPDWDASPFVDASPDSENISLRDSSPVNSGPSFGSSYGDSTRPENIAWFLECMSSFTTSICKKRVLVLNIMPLAYNREPEFKEWVFECVKQLPQNLKLMIYDVVDYPLFEKIPKAIPCVDIKPDLEMGNAMREILTAGSGSGSTTAVDIHVCLFNMADSLKEKDLAGVCHWGKEAAKIGKELHNKSLEATAYLAYGSALFQLRKTDDAIIQYERAQSLAQLGIAGQDATAPSLLLQSYNFLAALYLFKKKRAKAAEYFGKTADTALEQNNLMIYVESSRQQAEMLRTTGEAKYAHVILKKAYENGKQLPPDTQKFSSMLLLCAALEASADDNNESVVVREIDEHASNIWGSDWRELAQGNSYKNLLTA